MDYRNLNIVLYYKLILNHFCVIDCIHLCLSFFFFFKC